MATEISKVIFQLDIEAKGVFDELAKVAGKYRETTVEVKKQEDEIAKLTKKEAELTAQRAKATNPTAIVKINKELKATQDLLTKEIELTKKLTKEMDKQEDAATDLGKKIEKAYENTIINAASVAVKGMTAETKKLTESTETNAQQLKRLNRELQELEPGTEAFISLAKEAGEVQDKIKTAADNVAVFSAASKATQAKTLFGQIGSDLADLNFADAATKAQTFASVINSISLKEITQGAKEFGSTMLNVGKSLLANPLVIFAAAIAGISYAIYTVIESYNDFIASSKSVDAAIDRTAQKITELTRRRIEAEVKLNVLRGKISQDEGKRQIEEMKNFDERRKLAEQFKNDIVTLAKEQDIDLSKLKDGRADESGFIPGVGRSQEVANKAIKFNRELIRLRTAFNAEAKALAKAQDIELELIQSEQDKARVERAKEQKDKLISLERQIIDEKIAIIKDERQQQVAQINEDARRRTEDVMKIVALEQEKSDLIILIEKNRLKKLSELDDIRLKRIEAVVNTERKIREDGLQAEFEKNMAAIEKIETERANKTKKFTNDEIEAINTVLQAALNAAEQLIAIEIRKQDALAEIQSKRVQQAAQIAERGNAEVLQQEQERLDEIQKKREAFVRAQQILQQVEIVGNATVAVSKAAAQGGVAAPATIAATIAALIAGYTLVRTLTQPEGFREGGYTGDGDPSEESNRLGKRGYKYHKKEFIFNEGITKKNLPTFRKIHRGEIDLQDTMAKAKLFEQLPMPLLNNLLIGQSMRNAQRDIDTSRLENIMSSVEKAIKNKPEVAFNINERGFQKYWKQVIYKEERIKNAAS